MAASDKFLSVHRQFWTNLWLPCPRWLARACIPPEKRGFKRRLIRAYGYKTYFLLNLVLVLTIFNEGAYLIFKSISHKALNLFYFENHARICSWNQPVLSNKGKVSCSRKQQGLLMGLKPTTSTLQVRRATQCTTPPLWMSKVNILQCEVYFSLSW